MANEIGLGIDLVRLRLTGAVSAGAAQSDPALSLGAFWSSTIVPSRGFYVEPGGIPNLRIDGIGDETATGTGIISAAGASLLALVGPGGTVGSTTTIADNESKVVQSGGAGGHVRVTRTSADSMFGSSRLRVIDVYNHGVGMEDVSSADRTTGKDYYRALMLRNESEMDVAESVLLWVEPLSESVDTDDGQLGSSGSGTVQTTGSFAAWDDAGYAHIVESDGSTREIVYYTSRTATALTVPAAGRGLLGTSAGAGGALDVVYQVPGIRIGLEEPTAGEIQDVADAHTAPTGITWSASPFVETPLETGVLEPGDTWGLWVHRHVPVGIVKAGPVVRNTIGMLWISS